MNYFIDRRAAGFAVIEASSGQAISCYSHRVDAVRAMLALDREAPRESLRFVDAHDGRGFSR